jgi:hypothetical protein
MRRHPLPAVPTGVVAANHANLDRDKDGTACEA